MESTSSISKGRFARVAVEVDITMPLVPGSDVELEGLDMKVFWQSFEFEHIHLYCGACGRVGHRRLNCSEGSSSNLGSQSFAAVKSSSIADLSSPVPADVDMPLSSEPQEHLSSVNDDSPAPVAWIHVHRRGQKPRQSTKVNSGNQAPSLARASTQSRGSARGRAAARCGQLAPPLGPSDQPLGGCSIAPKIGTRGDLSASPSLESSQQSEPPIVPLHIEPGATLSCGLDAGYFGPLGLLDNPNNDVIMGQVEVVATDLINSSPSAFENSVSGALGTGNSEAQPQSIPSSSTSVGQVHISSSSEEILTAGFKASLNHLRAGLKSSNTSSPLPSSSMDVDRDSPATSAVLLDLDEIGQAGGKANKKKNKKPKPYSTPKPAADVVREDNLIIDLVDKERAARLRKMKHVDLLQDPVPVISQEMMVGVASACGFSIQGDPAVTFALLQELEARR